MNLDLSIAVGIAQLVTFVLMLIGGAMTFGRVLQKLDSLAESFDSHSKREDILFDGIHARALDMEQRLARIEGRR